jgi:hypothetical protein
MVHFEFNAEILMMMASWWTHPNMIVYTYKAATHKLFFQGSIQNYERHGRIIKVLAIIGK